MREWKIKRLVDYWEFNPKVSVNNNKEYSFIEMPDLMPGNKEVLPSRERKPQGLTKFQNGDTLFAKITPCLENGKICQAQGLKDNIGVGSTEFFVFRGRKGISDNDFVHYLLKWYPIRKHAESCMSGSAGHQRVPSDAFDSIELPLPDYLESVEIANLLSLLDKKITLLRQQNHDLEELAQTLFKRWFVEFEFPNENGEPYKSSGGKMVSSELGEIPEGWRVGALENFISIKHGYAFKGEYITNIENNQILVTPGSFKIGGGFNLSKFKYYNSEFYPEEYKFRSNDLAVTMTDLSKDGDSLGFPALIPEVNGKILLHNQRVGKVIVNENLKYFFYFLMQRREYRAHVVGSSTGTTVRHTSPIRICDFKYIFDEKVMRYFGKVVEPNLIKIINNISEIQTLIQLRDTLLPKLMSGELKVAREEKNAAVD
ncbi:restriction endonuclease subunit S [Geofilum rubicundum]|uniref:Type I restriction-modification system, specificity subunit S n=1 Tax=Geofilum rubicundum JCM 15548 TaxID=1236989 RepID=A0A0E9M1B0_9BACT|nr:restriction endonuclease subunit S [Geofilum rubicundum]GAO31353.1 type I restriction-modification system, specificity subunit S [Geofilum rubicundum JCM 15548]